MKLFYKAGACSLTPHIILEETGLPYTAESVDLQSKRTASGADFLAINPKGYVPALQLDDGTVLTEVAAIVQYLADQAPATQLAPANGSLQRYQLQSWLAFISSELHKNFSVFFKPYSSDNDKLQAKANIERRLGLVNEQVSGGKWLLGDAFSVADIYLFNVLNWSGFIQLDLSAWPHVQALQARVAQRPATQAALRAEGLA